MQALDPLGVLHTTALNGVRNRQRRFSAVRIYQINRVNIVELVAHPAISVLANEHFASAGCTDFPARVGNDAALIPDRRPVAMSSGEEQCAAPLQRVRFCAPSTNHRIFTAGAAKVSINDRAGKTDCRRYR